MTNNHTYDVVAFGTEQQPVVIIDDFIKQPRRLVDKAAAKQFHLRGSYYPGIRAPADPAYLGETAAQLTDILETVFGLHGGAKLVECNFSLVTTQPDKLMPIQCLPHFDGVDPGRIAVLHYLSKPEQGGTAFYRHKKTGFETVTADRFKQFEAALQAEAKEHGLPAKKYFTAANDRYDQIGKIEAAFNRCIIYRGITLHSGDIPADLAFDKNPATGRLTVNTFLAGR